jgi:hypothetical protein
MDNYYIVTKINLLRACWDFFRLASLGERNFMNAAWEDFRFAKIFPGCIHKNKISRRRRGIDSQTSSK